jgi:hypothetical protein
MLGAAYAHGPGDYQRSAEGVEPAWLEGSSLLVLDTRPPPVAPLMNLYRRQNGEEASPTRSSRAATSTLATDPQATPSDFTIPRPFDTALSNNFTAPCAAFFRTFLTNNDFLQCHPFSLLLQVRWRAPKSDMIPLTV